MTIDELIQELDRIRTRWGGSLPVSAKIDTKKTVWREDEDGNRWEEIKKKTGQTVIDSCTDEIAAHPQSKRMVVLR
jgi:hypothetical protein